MSANKLYDETDKSKKSPGQWLTSKDVKSLVEELESNPTKDDDGIWTFDELLLGHYDLYLNPKKISQMKNGAVQKNDLEDVQDECRRAFIEFLTGKSYSVISKLADIEEVFEGLPEEIKIQYKSFAYQFKTKLTTHRNIEQRARQFALNDIISTLRFNLDETKELFRNDKCIIKFRNTREL